MVEISVTYEGDLHTRALHGPSSSALETDAPKDNEGRGEAFSPTHMVAEPVRRVGKLVVEFAMPAVPEKARPVLERTAHTCPVHQSLHPDVDVDVRFDWSGAA
jgi:putative redox protein